MTIWRAEQSAFEPLLNRAEADANVDHYFADVTKAMSDMVDYGTHLIPRCLGSSQKRFKDLVALPVLLKQAVAFLDAGHVLLSRGVVTPALLQCRAMLEVSLYLQWILIEDGDRRASSYYVWHLRRQLNWINRATRGTIEYQALSDDLQGLVLPDRLKDPEEAAKADEQRNEIERLLALEPYRALNDAFAKLKGRRRADPAWYAPVTPQGLRPTLYSIAQQLGRTAEYRLIYEQGSEVTHGTQFEANVRIDQGQVGLRSLRELTDLPLVAQMLMGVGVFTYRLVLDTYRPSEGENFARSYVERWRHSYINRKTVQYRYSVQTIDL